MIFLHSEEQLRALTYLQLMIMHASLDTDIHGGMKRDGSNTQYTRDGRFVPILSFDFRENSILKGCIENAVEKRTREISTRLYSFSTKTDSGGIAVSRQKYPNYSRPLSEWSVLRFETRETRQSMKFADTCKKRKSSSSSILINFVAYIS